MDIRARSIHPQPDPPYAGTKHLGQASLALACAYIIVGTHPANLAAQAYYQKLGFYPKGPSGIRFTLAVN